MLSQVTKFSVISSLPGYQVTSFAGKEAGKSLVTW